MKVKTKICKNKNCTDSYFKEENKFTKWRWELKECPTCKQKLGKYVFEPAIIKLRK